MASGWYQQGLEDALDNTLNLDTDTLKVMLVTSSYTYDADHTVVDNGGNDATDPSFNELTVSGYTGGFGGAGRKTTALAMNVDNTNNAVDIELNGGANQTWTSLASGETIGGAILIKEITADTSSRLICFFDVTDTATNGGDVTLTWSALASGGNMTVTV
jgi:hypothetical protein